MRSEKEIREKLETIRNTDYKGEMERENMMIYKLALCWVLDKYSKRKSKECTLTRE